MKKLPKISWINITGNGNNALDFHIAFHIASKIWIPNTKHFIVSNDKGFDPLIKHINSLYKIEKVYRIANMRDYSRIVKDEELRKTMLRESKANRRRQRKNHNYEEAILKQELL